MNRFNLHSFDSLARFCKEDKRLIADCDWTVFDVKNLSFDNINEFNRLFSKTYIVQAQFISTKNQLEVVSNYYEPFKSDEIWFEKYSYLDVTRLEQCVDNFKEFFTVPWRSYLGDDNLEMYNLQPFLEKETSDFGFVYRRGTDEPISIVASFDHVNINGVKVRQIGWAWVKESLKQEIRKCVHQSLLNSILSSDYHTFQAGVLSRNIRSINFMKKLGFQPLCLYLRPL